MFFIHCRPTSVQCRVCFMAWSFRWCNLFPRSLRFFSLFQFLDLYKVNKFKKRNISAKSQFSKKWKVIALRVICNNHIHIQLSMYNFLYYFFMNLWKCLLLFKGLSMVQGWKLIHTLKNYFISVLLYSWFSYFIMV